MVTIGGPQHTLVDSSTEAVILEKMRRTRRTSVECEDMWKQQLLLFEKLKVGKLALVAMGC